MAESSLENLGPRPSFGQPVVNDVGRPLPDAAIAQDRRLNLPFERYPPLPTPPPAPPPVPESERRQKLAAALAAQGDAAAKLDAATAAHERAMRHQQRCQAAVANYAGLAAEIDEFTVTALRGDGKAGLPEAMRRRIGERDVAQAELASAERAVAVLLQERAAAADANTKAGSKVTEALESVIDAAKDVLRPERHRLRQRVAAIEQLLNRGATATVWAAVTERLKLDPLGGSLDIVVPDAPEPDPVPEPFVFKNEIADPETGELITFQELGIRSHQRRLAAGASETIYQKIERARAQQAALAGGGVRTATVP